MNDIGIFMLANSLDRPVGDVGNPDTFAFPVTMAKTPGATAERVVEQSGAGVLDAVRETTSALREEGVGAITSCCGYFAIFQDELANDLDVPVATSSLLQIPLIQRLIRPDQSVGVVTANSGTLTDAHLDAVGVGRKARGRVYLAGLEDCSGFQDFIHERADADVPTVESEVVGTVARAVAARPDTGAILLECTNLPPFTSTLKEAVGLPIWDAISLIEWLHAGVSAP